MRRLVYAETLVLADYLCVRTGAPAQALETSPRWRTVERPPPGWHERRICRDRAKRTWRGRHRTFQGQPFPETDGIPPIWHRFHLTILQPFCGVVKSAS